MKLLFLALLTTFSLASTNTLLPSEATNQLTIIPIDNYECNLHLERASLDLLSFDKAEQASNIPAIQQAFHSFMTNSNLAIKTCSSINEAITADIMEVQANIAYYYYQHYK